MKKSLKPPCMTDLITKKLSGKKVVLLGFGREGQSSYRVIREALPTLPLVIADRDESVHVHPLVANDLRAEFRTGQNYLDDLDEFDVIIKSPGIALHKLGNSIPPAKITSQTDLFLQEYSRQVIGVTGTKGKSTTVSLIRHILKQYLPDVILLGNIGRPPFDCLEYLSDSTEIVDELSSHQLEYLTKGPRIAVLLNIYQEHLDAYNSYRDYQLAKMNITKCQDAGDYLIYNADDPIISGHLDVLNLARNRWEYSMQKKVKNGCFIVHGFIVYCEDSKEEKVWDLRWKRKLKGDHNLMNIMAAINVCKIKGVPDDIIAEGISSFRGLEHRIEFAGRYRGIDFYNDSIATIPEATIEAVKALQNVDTIILGGFDRGIDYSGLARFLGSSHVRNFILTGEAGKRIMSELEKTASSSQKLILIQRFDDFRDAAVELTKEGEVCLLSPAAASYDEFPNFEVRGKRFKELVNGLEG
jgi:UDP-N-acetylmuramoyl-L-alanine---L-glutamate ligase